MIWMIYLLNAVRHLTLMVADTRYVRVTRAEQEVQRHSIDSLMDRLEVDLFEERVSRDAARSTVCRDMTLFCTCSLCPPQGCVIEFTSSPLSCPFPHDKHVWFWMQWSKAPWDLNLLMLFEKIPTKALQMEVLFTSTILASPVQGRPTHLPTVPTNHKNCTYSNLQLSQVNNRLVMVYLFIIASQSQLNRLHPPIKKIKFSISAAACRSLAFWWRTSVMDSSHGVCSGSIASSRIGNDSWLKPLSRCNALKWRWITSWMAADLVQL